MPSSCVGTFLSTHLATVLRPSSASVAYTRRRGLAALAMLLSLICTALIPDPNLRAEVVDAEDHGFTVRQELAIVAPPETVWRMLVGHVGEWWHSDHTYSGDAANLYIEARPLGCFCERLSESDAVVHLTVTVIRENSLLRLTGGLGPLGLMGVDGNMTLSLVSDTGLTRLAMQYQVGGYSPDGLKDIAPAVDAMLGEQLTRLVRFIESGSPEPVLDEELMPEANATPGDGSGAEENPLPQEDGDTSVNDSGDLSGVESPEADDPEVDEAGNAVSDGDVATPATDTDAPSPEDASDDL